MRGCPACAETNPERARFCLACGHALEGDDTRSPVELRRTVSVVFADLAGSTILGEALDAEPLRYVTGRFFEAMRAAVERHEGSVEKFIGDAVVAVFGIPRVREDDALRAVRAADEMCRALPQLNEELKRDFDVRLQVRIGVNTGEVVVGEARAGGSAATGDAVNVAARLEQAADPGTVLLGDATHRLVRDYVDVEPVPHLTLKGKANAVQAWRLIAVADAPRHEDRQTAFLGRDAQMRVLREAFRRVSDERACQLVTVLGAAGMGKTRLATEFAGSLDDDDATVLFGHCLSYGDGATYWPLREAVLAAAKLTGDETAAEAAETLRGALADIPDTDNVVRRLLALVGHDKDSSVPEDMAWAVRRYLESLASQRPVVLVVDDLHWAEPGLLDLIEHIADWSRDAPILLLVLARPEFFDTRPTWGGGKLNATSMLLSALDDDASAALVQKHDLPAQVQRRIVETGGGNPLFVQQLVAMLVDTGHAEDHDGVVTWQDAPTADVVLALPPSVSTLLAARIDRLSAHERAVVGCASVIGAVFYVEAVATLIGASTSEVRSTLDALVRRELLRPAASDLPGVTAYRFLHALVRDAAYDGLAKHSRAEWHERLAEWLLAHYAEVVPDEIVGHHLAAAWDYRRQIGPSNDHTRDLARRGAERLAAGARRLQLSDVAAAASLTERAVAMLEPGDPLQSQCLLALGQQRFDLGQVPQAREALTVAVQSGTGAEAQLAKVMLCRVNSYTAEHRVDDSEQILAESLQRFTARDDHRGLAWSYLVAAELEAYANHISGSLSKLTLAMEHAKASGDAVCAATVRGLLGVFYLFGRTPAEEVIATLDGWLVDSGNDPRVRPEVELVTCVMHAMCGRFDQAHQLAADCRLHLAEVGHGLFLANLAQSSGHVEELAGDLDAAEREYQRSVADLERLGESAYLSTVAGLHARLLARRGKRAEATQAMALARVHGSPDDAATQSLVLQTEALLAAGDGDASRARAALRFLEVEDPAEVPDGAGEAFRTAADVEHALGDAPAEQRHLRAAMEAFAAKGNIVREREVARRLSC